MRLARACLSVGKAGYFGALEGVLDEGTNAELVNFLISRCFVESEVKIERGFLEVLREVDLLPA